MPFTPRDEGYVPPHLPTIKREVNKLMEGVKRVGAKQTNVFVSATSGYAAVAKFVTIAHMICYL